MARVLVIDSDPQILSLLDEQLRAVGHEVVSARTGAQGLELARELLPDLVLLELQLPDGRGNQICWALRELDVARRPRLVIVSASGDEIDRVVGFELGADDYVVKPFSVRELLLRVRTVLRRGASDPPPLSKREFGLVRIDRDAHRVWVSGVEVALTALEFRLLQVLHERPDRVQSREMLLQAVWGFDARTSARTVDAVVKRLRDKLGEARDAVETVRNVGYRFTARRGEGGPASAATAEPEVPPGRRSPAA